MENEMEIEKSSKLREERRKVVSDSSPEEFVKRKKISKKKTVFTDSSPEPSSKRRRIEKTKTDQGNTEIDKEMEIARSKSSTSQKTKRTSPALYCPTKDGRQVVIHNFTNMVLHKRGIKERSQQKEDSRV
ncbi:uncharacterized protein LOC135169541 [Diachasmimorpha longicaudata]|uniref:uncharacterized protein LOC135169541 n=1 Tax=Diachasmimorpha longicaudata TaxID=58733 RepID=UPI0030B8B02B